MPVTMAPKDADPLLRFFDLSSEYAEHKAAVSAELVRHWASLKCVLLPL